MQKSSDRKWRSVLIVLTVAVFAVLFGVANPAEVKAGDANISGVLNASDLVNPTGNYQMSNDGTETLNLTGDTELTLDIEELKIKQINGDGHVLTIKGYKKLTVVCDDDAHPAIDAGNVSIEGGEVYATGRYAGITAHSQPGGGPRGDITITGTNTVVNATGEDFNGLFASNEMSIKGGTVTATTEGDSEAILVGKLTITGGTVTAKGIGTATANGIEVYEDLKISGSNTILNAKGNTFGIRAGDGIDIREVGIAKPEGGKVIYNNVYYYVGKGGAISKDVEIRKLKDRNDYSRSSSHSSSDDAPAAITNPLALFLGKMTGLPYGTYAARTEQGPVAKAAFAAARPAGYVEGFTFNLITNGKSETTLKAGTFTMVIPKDLRKAGRTFAITGLDKNGKPHTYVDIDTDPTTITVAVNLEGYAFELIYKD